MKALEILKFFKELDEWVKFCFNFPSNKKLDEAISELEVLQHRSCESCRLREADDQACSLLTHALFELDLMPNSFCCNRYEKEQ